MNVPAVEPLEARIAPALLHPFALNGVNGTNGVQINGSGSETAGEAVSRAGDINDDGLEDFVIGAIRAAPHGDRSGAAYVVFGSTDTQASTLNLSSLNGTNGFKLNGDSVDGFAGYSVSAAGDVNGDGIDDLLIGARGQGTNTGAAYVVFGKSTAFDAELDLSTLDGATGFKLAGVNQHDYTGSGVAAGDINGDGFSDVIIGASGVDVNSDFNTGVVYVIYGKDASMAAFTATVAPSFRIVGEASIHQTGISVASGDINGDGFDDIVVGAQGADPHGSFSGAAYVVFGKSAAFTGDVLLSSILATTAGFKINGSFIREDLGFRVSAGDINGDGKDEVIVGAPAIGDEDHTGSAYVVFGKGTAFTSPIEVTALDGTDGFRVSGVQNDASTGYAVKFAGDVNNDGFGDLLVGAPDVFTGPVGTPAFGEAYLIFGHNGTYPAVVQAASIDGTNGVKFRGVNNDYAGNSVAGIGDFNGDGFDDVLVGSLRFNSGIAPGLVFLVFGGEPSAAPQVVISANGKTATYTDADGEKVTVKTTKGKFLDTQFEITGGKLDKLNLAGAAGFAGANITISAKKTKTTDGIVSVGTIDATGIDLGKVTVKGPLGAILCGDADPVKAALGGLSVKSLGATGLAAPLVSTIKGNAGTLTIGGDVEGSDFEVLGGGIKKVTVTGSIIGGAMDFSGFIYADGVIGSATVRGSLRGGAGLDSGTIESDAGFGKVSITGDLDGGDGQGSGGISAFGPVKSITVGGSLLGGDAFGAGSIYTGGAGDLGAVGSIVIRGNVVAGTHQRTGIILGATAGSISITGDVTGTAAVPAKIVVEGLAAPVDQKKSVALGSLTIGGKVEFARILAGYDDMLAPTHSDASIGKVLVKKTWTATDLVAGVKDATADGFGRNDTLIPGDTTPTIFGTIASITIKGVASGSATSSSDFFGITAEHFVKLILGKATTKFVVGTAEDISLDAGNSDFHAVDFA